MSAVLNTLSGTLYTDFIEKCLPMKVSDERASTHMKMVSLVIGAFSIAMIFVVEHLGGVLQVAISFMGITAGASNGLFILGMFFPWANSIVRVPSRFSDSEGRSAPELPTVKTAIHVSTFQGAIAGAVSSLIFMVFMVGGNSLAIASKELTYATLPTRVDGCFAKYAHHFRRSVQTHVLEGPRIMCFVLFFA